jgi:flagellar hook-length control protein FliK
MPAQTPAANGQAAANSDAAPLAAVQTGRAATLPTDPTGAAAATVAAAVGTTTKPSTNANAGVDSDAATDAGADSATGAPSRRTAGFHNLSDDASAASDTARASARPDTAATGARERTTSTALPGTNTNANANANANAAPMASGWSTAVNGNANTDPGQTVTVKLPPQSPEQWRQPLTEALGDRLQLQLGRNSEQATIRLDPPMLGSIEISIRHEAGSLQVQLSASNGEVLRQLHGIGDSLRQDLSQRPGDVSVVVSDSSRNATNADQQRGRERDAETAEDGPGRALAEAESETGTARTPFSLARERE